MSGSPPTVLDQMPDDLVTSKVTKVDLTISMPLDGSAARDGNNYRLLHLGADRVVGGGDDQTIPVLPVYADGGTNLALTTTASLLGWKEIDYGFPRGILGDWQLSAGNTAVTQKLDGGTTFFVSDFTLTGGQFAARVEAPAGTADDDFLGFVFGFQDNPETGLPDNYYLLSWKRAAEGLAERGLKLSKITGTGTSGNRPDLFDLNSTDPRLDVLATGPDVGWEPGVTYDLELNYASPGTSTLTLRRADTGTLVWNHAFSDLAPLGPGKVGFYNFGVPEVKYLNLNLRDGLPDGFYQLTAFAGESKLRGADGIPLDGDNDGQAGGDYVGTFAIQTATPAATLDLRAADDTGASNSDNITRTRVLNFDVTVNQIGRLLVDLNGDGLPDSVDFGANGSFETSFFAPAAGTYTFRTASLTDGARNVQVALSPAIGNPANSTLSVTVDNAGPALLAGDDTADSPWLSQTFTFSEALDPASFTPADLVFTAPDGTTTIPVADVTGSGVTYAATFPQQIAPGVYRFVVGPGITDLAGNLMNRDGDGTPGEPADAYEQLVSLDPDTFGPTITAVTMSATSLQVTYFDASGLDESTVTNPANYRLRSSGGDGLFGEGNEIDQSSAIGQITFNPATGVATLALAPGLPDERYELVVNGSNDLPGENPVRDLAGNLLLGGTDYRTELVLNRGAATVLLDLAAASDSGISATDNLTNDNTPTFDVTVNKPGRIVVDFDGDGPLAAVEQLVTAAGTYSFTAAELADGSYPARATFTPAVGMAVNSTVTVTVDTAGPKLAGVGQGAGLALKFDGNDLVTISNGTQLDAIETGDKLTVEAWVRIDGFTGGWFSVVDKYRPASDSGWRMEINQANGLHFNTGASGDLFSGAGVSVGRWQHVAIAYDRAEGVVRFFIDGLHVGTRATTADLIQTEGGPLYLGFNPSGSDEFVNGALDEFRLWSVARTPAEIAADYNRSLTGREPGLVGYWRFDEGAGNVVRDATGNLPDGTFGSGSQAPARIGSGANIVSSFDQFTPPVDQVPVSFSEPIVAATFVAAETTVSGPQFSLPAPATAVVGGGANYLVQFPTIDTLGRYTLSVPATITDLAGNSLVPPTSDTFDVVRDTSAPFVTSFAPLGVQNSPVGTLSVTFNEDMDAASFTGADVTIRDDQGATLSFASVTVTPSGARSFEITLDPPLTADGGYTVTLGPDILDRSANPLAVPFTAVVTIDRTGPRVVSSSPAGLVTEPVASLEFAFNEPVRYSTNAAQSSLTLADVAITGPGGGAIVPMSLTSLGNNRYRVGFPEQRANGLYQVVVGPQVLDLAGNLLDQDGDGTPGEPGEDAFAGGFTISLPDLIVDSVADLAPQVFGESFTVGWQVSNPGVAPPNEQREWVDRVYLSSNNQLDAADFLLGEFPVPLEATPDQGGFYLGTLEVTAPLATNLPPGDYYILVMTDAGNRVVEDDESSASNLRAAGPVTFTRPPLPNLVPLDVQAAETLVLPGTDVGVSWLSTNPGALLTAGRSWREAVYLSRDASSATPADDVLLRETTYSGPLGPDAARDAAVTVPAFGFSGQAWLVVRVDTLNAIQEETETDNAALGPALTIPTSLSLVLSSEQVREDAPNPALRGVITRNGDLSQPLVVQIESSDVSELFATRGPQVIIPAGQPSLAFDLTVVNDDQVDGPQDVIITARAMGFADVSDAVRVLDTNLPKLTLLLDQSSLTEGDSTTARIRREVAGSQLVAVALSASVPGQLAFPPAVSIPAGETLSAPFTITAVNDSLVELTQAYSLVVQANGHTGGSAQITVAESDIPALTLALLQTTVSEGAPAPAGYGLVTRSVVTDRPLTVFLTSSNPAAATVPSAITIPANAASAQFGLAATNDALVDGVQTTVITARAATSQTNQPLEQTAVTAALNVADDDGLALFVTINQDLVAEGGAGSGVVRRNTADTSQPLVVTLASSDLTELRLDQPEITIPVGASQAPFTFVGLADGVVDGNQTVEISATALDFAAGVDSVIVSDRNLPDLVVSRVERVGGGATARTNQLLTYEWQVTNQGVAAAESRFSQRLFLSRDALYSGDDVLAGQVNYRPFAQGGQPADPEGPLDPGQSFSRTNEIRLPNEPGTYFIILLADAGGELTELSDLNNAQVSAPLTVNVAYQADLTVAVTNPLPGQSDIALAGTPVEFTGRAIDADSGLPLGGADVALRVFLRGTRREAFARTDTAGNYRYLFTPLPGEAGEYSVLAGHPGLADANVPASGRGAFTLIGMRAEPPSTSLDLIEAGAKRSASVTLRNLSDVPLAGLAAEIVGTPANVVFDPPVISPGSALGPMATATLTLTGQASDASIRQASVRVVVTTVEGVRIEIPLTVNVEALRPRLVAEPGSLSVGALVNSQTVVEFSVANRGGRASGPLDVLLPNLPWVTVATPQPLPSLEPGQSARITLLLSPPSSLLPATPVFNGSLVVRGAGSEAPGDETDVSVPFTFRALSDMNGDLAIEVVDEFTYYAEGAPRLAGATVTLTDAASGAVVRTTANDTDGNPGDGFFTFTGLMEGYYNLVISADKHSTYRATILVRPGQTNSVLAFLTRETVSYTWTVTPTEVEDRTNITIETTFETNVPVPVVVIDRVEPDGSSGPPVIDLAELQNIGQTMQVNLRLTNHGLIAAQDVALSFGTHPFYEIKPLVDDIGILGAKQAVTIPVIVTRTADFDTLRIAAGAQPNGQPGVPQPPGADPMVPCGIPAQACWSYPCGPQDVGKCTSIPITNVEGNCPSAGPGGGPVGGGSASTGTGSSPYQVPVTISPPPIDCQFCIDFELGEYDLSYLLEPAEIAIEAFVIAQVPFLKDFFDVELEASVAAELCCTDQGQGFGVEGSISGEAKVGKDDEGELEAGGEVTLDLGFEVVASLAGALRYSYDASISLNANGTIAKECEESTLCGAVSVGAAINLSGEADGSFSGSLAFPDVDKAREFLEGLGISLPDYSAVFAVEGMAKLGLGGGGNGDIGYDFCESMLTGDLCFDGIYIEGVIELTAFGRSIIDVKIDDLLKDDCRDGRYYFANPACMFGTHPYYEERECDMPEVPSAALLDTLTDNSTVLNVVYDFDAVINDLRRLAAQDGESGEVCAQVRLRIDQQAIVTRDAFDATLELMNKGGTPLDGVEVDVVITDADGNLANDRFGFRPPTTTRLGGSWDPLTQSLRGGSVIGGETGTASFILIPNSEAAPDASQQYFVGGTLRYIQDGLLVEVPLTPAPITVFPNASLRLKYFQERDVLSDDPFTDDVVEPTIPFQLSVLVVNDGAGAARNMRINSSQPKIVDNEKGLLVDFDIIGTQVQTSPTALAPTSPALNVNFGNIGPRETRQATWLMTSTLQGLFTEYKATLEHLDDLGDPRLRIVQSAEIYELIRSVQAGGAGPSGTTDSLPDFLVNYLADPNDRPDTVHLSDGTVVPVGVAADVELDDDEVTKDDLEIELTALMPEGWGYLNLIQMAKHQTEGRTITDPGFRTSDPRELGYRLKSVRRADGTELPAANFWQTDRTFIGGGKRPTYEHNLHLFDYAAAAGPASYTLVYERQDQARPTIVSLETVVPDPRTTAVDSLVIEFNKPIDLATFDYEDLVLSFNDGPENRITPAVSITGLGDNRYQISGLGALTDDDGQYRLTVFAAGIEDEFGNAGLGVENDNWTKGDFAPAVDFFSGVPDPLRTTAVAFVDAVFNKPIDLATFDVADLELTRNGESLALGTGVRFALLFADPPTYRITGLGDVTNVDGHYAFTVNATGLTDLTGRFGETETTIEWTLDREGPNVEAIRRLPAAEGGLGEIEVDFLTPIDPNSFGLSDLFLRRGTSPANLIASGVTIVPQSPDRFRIRGLGTISAPAGLYTFEVNLAGITDLAGNPGEGTSSAEFDRLPPPAPSNLAVSPATLGPGGIWQAETLTVTLSGGLGEEGLSVSLFDTTVGASLGPPAVLGSGFSQPITFATSGSHRVRVTASDAAGNSSEAFLDVFVNLTTVLDITAPDLVSLTDIDPNPRTAPVDSLLVTFSEPLAPGTFGAEDLRLIRNGDNVNLINADVSVVPLGAGQYQINGLGGITTPDGDYLLELDTAGVIDPAQNAGAGVTSRAWTKDETPPTSEVEQLPPSQLSTSFTVKWAGDDGTGLGVADYTVYVSIDGGTFSPWQVATTATEAEYTGEIGRRYAFYSVARDALGNVEPAPAAADAAIRLLTQTPPGDANGDGNVDTADYTIWAATNGQRGENLPADFNRDGVVGLADYALWSANLGHRPGTLPVPPPGPGSHASVASDATADHRKVDLLFAELGRRVAGDHVAAPAESIDESLATDPPRARRLVPVLTAGATVSQPPTATNGVATARATLADWLASLSARRGR